MNGALDDLFQVAFSQFKYDVQRFKPIEVFRFYDIEKLNHIWMFQPAEESDLSQNAFAINLIIEYTVHLLDSDFLTCWFVDSGSYLTI